MYTIVVKATTTIAIIQIRILGMWAHKTRSFGPLYLRYRDAYTVQPRHDLYDSFVCHMFCYDSLNSFSPKRRDQYFGPFIFGAFHNRNVCEREGSAGASNSCHTVTCHDTLIRLSHRIRLFVSCFGKLKRLKSFWKVFTDAVVKTMGYWSLIRTQY